jgi:hypothetical protein
MSAAFYDLLAWLLGWQSAPAQRAPFRVEAAQVFVTGADGGQVFLTGAVEAEVYGD